MINEVRFHQPVWASMSVSTVESGIKTFWGETTLPAGEFSSQESWKILIDLPSPTLHRASFSISFLANKILFQAKELDDDFASKIELWEKYFALKTLK